MTPAIELLEQHNVEYRVRAYVHDAATDSYGKEAAAELHLSETVVYKTLVVELDNGELAVGVVPVANKLSTKAMARELGAKKAVMADGQRVSRVTGYVLGGVSPLAQKKQLPTLVDESARALQAIHISAGRRGLEVALNPDDLLALCDGRYAAIAAGA